jgi:hypothetical protein
MLLLKLLLCACGVAALRAVPTDAVLPSSSQDVLAGARAPTAPAALSCAAASAAAVATALATPAAAFAAATGAELDDYFATSHPEFAVGLVIHWILWGKAPRAVALAYDFGGLALFAAEPFFR